MTACWDGLSNRDAMYSWNGSQPFDSLQHTRTSTVIDFGPFTTYGSLPCFCLHFNLHRLVNGNIISSLAPPPHPHPQRRTLTFDKPLSISLPFFGNVRSVIFGAVVTVLVSHPQPYLQIFFLAHAYLSKAHAHLSSIVYIFAKMRTWVTQFTRCLVIMIATEIYYFWKYIFHRNSLVDWKNKYNTIYS